jgi:hypothetical protein
MKKFHDQILLIKIRTAREIFIQSLYILSQRTQLSEHFAVTCHLLHVSAVSGHLQVDFTTTYTQKYTEVEAFSSLLIGIIKHVCFEYNGL